MSRMVIYDAPRYSLVGWLSDVMDLRKMGEPERTVTVNGDCEIVHGLTVLSPFGPGTDGSLVIHAWRGNGNDGGDITLAISDTVYRRELPKRLTKASFYPTQPAPEST